MDLRFQNLSIIVIWGSKKINPQLIVLFYNVVGHVVIVSLEEKHEACLLLNRLVEASSYQKDLGTPKNKRIKNNYHTLSCFHAFSQFPAATEINYTLSLSLCLA